MRLSPLVSCLFAVALCFTGTMARADFQVKQTVHIMQTIPDTLAFRKMPANQRAMMEKQMVRAPYSITTHLHGHATRLDYGPYYELAKPGQASFLIVNASTRTYLVQTFSYFRDNAGIQPIKVIVQRTSRTRTIMGHRCHDYHLSSRPGDPAAFTSDVWAADDIPNTPGPMAEAVFNGVYLDPWASIKGLPLEVTAQIGTKKAGIVRLSISTTSVSSHSEPQAMFTAPKGYLKSQLN